MNIQDALKETGKAMRKGGADNYAMLKHFSLSSSKQLGGDRLYWYGVETHEENSPVQLDPIFEDDWQPYHPKEEISPKEAGELWKQGDGEGEHHYYFTFEEKGILRFRSERIHDFVDWPGMIHNQNGWKRLFPEIPNENEIVIEGVVFGKIQGENGAHYTSIISTACNGPRLETIRDKRMTMKLIPKEA